jgi:hypothetical protein
MTGPVVEGGLSESAPAHTPTFGDIVGLWRVRRLSWRGLPRSVLVPVVAVSGLVALTTLILVAFALNVAIPGGQLTVPSFVGNAPQVVDTLFVAFMWLALAVVSAAALSLAGREDAPQSRVIAIAVALVMFTFLADLVNVGDTLNRYDTVGLVQGSLAIWRIYQGAGWIGVVASVAILLMPRRGFRASPLVPVLLGAGPYLLGLFAFFAAGAVTYQLPGSPEPLSAQALAARPFVDNGEILTYGIVLVVFWKAATWARAGSVLIGLRASALAQRWQWLLGIVLAGKLVFLAVGYLTAGSCTSGPFAASRCDEPVAWLIAAGFALAATVWLMGARRWPITAQRLTIVAATVVIGFAAVSLVLVLSRPVTALAALLEIGGRVNVGSFPECMGAVSGMTPLVSCAFQAVDGLVAWPVFLTTAGALVIGAVIVARRSPDALPVGLPLLVFGLWATPRALGAFQIEILGMPEETVPNLGFELVTFDTVLTLFIGVAVFALWQRRAVSRAAPSLALVLVVSLLMAHGSTLIPADLASTLFVLMLPLPILYVLLVDSGGLNRSDLARPTEVLRFMVISGSLLLLATAALAFHTTGPGGSIYDVFAELLFLAPFAMITVAALITEMRAPATEVAV